MATHNTFHHDNCSMPKPYTANPPIKKIDFFLASFMVSSYRQTLLKHDRWSNKSNHAISELCNNRLNRSYVTLHAKSQKNKWSSHLVRLPNNGYVNVNNGRYAAILNLIKSIFFKMHPLLLSHILFYSNGPAI